jgi:hypothetical protein
MVCGAFGSEIFTGKSSYSLQIFYPCLEKIIKKKCKKFLSCAIDFSRFSVQ